MNNNEKYETIGAYVIFIGTMIPVFFKNVSAIIWIVIVVTGLGLLARGYKKVKENHE